MACGGRTVQMQLRFGNAKQAFFKGKPFDILDTTIDFKKKSKNLASVGVTKTGQVREVILVTEMDQKTILEDWIAYASKQPIPRTLQETLNLVDQYTQQLLPFAENKGLAFIEAQNRDAGNFVTINGEIHQGTFLSDYIKHRCGICRHHALINAIILGFLVKAKLLPEGEVRHFRNDVNTFGTGHSVATYVRPNGEIWVIDSLNYNAAFQINPAIKTTEKSSLLAADFKKFVGPDYYQNLLDRLLGPKPKKANKVVNEALAATVPVASAPSPDLAAPLMAAANAAAAIAKNLFQVLPLVKENNNDKPAIAKNLFQVLPLAKENNNDKPANDLENNKKNLKDNPTPLIPRPKRPCNLNAIPESPRQLPLIPVAPPVRILGSLPEGAHLQVCLLPIIMDKSPVESYPQVKPPLNPGPIENDPNPPSTPIEGDRKESSLALAEQAIADVFAAAVFPPPTKSAGEDVATKAAIFTPQFANIRGSARVPNNLPPLSPQRNLEEMMREQFIPAVSLSLGRPLLSQSTIPRNGQLLPKSYLCK
jgi:hypothetical protein